MGIKRWIFNIALKKVVTRLVILGVSFIATLHLDKLGISIDQAILQQAATAAIFGGLEMLRNFLKVKFGWDWL